MKIIDISILSKWENLHSWWCIKCFFDTPQIKEVHQSIAIQCCTNKYCDTLILQYFVPALTDSRINNYDVQPYISKLINF